MFTAAIVFCALTLPAIILTVYFDRADKRVLKTIFKGVASLCFVVAGALCYACKPSATARILILIALVMGAVGDVLLAVKTQNSNTQLMFDGGGMLSFIAGHILFAAAFFMLVDRFHLALLALIVALPIVVTILFGAKVLTSQKSIMQIGAVFYALIIGITLAAASNVVIYADTKSSTMIVVGSVLFTASDLILAFLNYNEKAPRKILFPAVLFLYYSGQLILALSLAC